MTPLDFSHDDLNDLTCVYSMFSDESGCIWLFLTDGEDLFHGKKLHTNNTTTNKHLKMYLICLITFISLNINNYKTGIS